MSQRSALVEYIIHSPIVLINVDFVREIWMIPERLVGIPDGNDFILKLMGDLYPGKLFVHEGEFYGVLTFTRVDSHNNLEKVYKVTATRTFIPYNPQEIEPLAKPGDQFELRKGDIDNFTDDKPIQTSLGRYIANYLFLVYPFQDAIPYINGVMNTSMIEAEIAKRLMNKTIAVQDVNDKYIDTLTLFGQSNEIMCSSITEKTMTIPNSIVELRNRLVSENQAALDRGDASVMAMIEGELISAYRTYLGDDESADFLIKAKYYKVTLKKLLLTQGMVETFGSPGKFKFVAQPMGSGWKQKDLPTIFNEVRQGSFARAVETANGGVIAKLILRVLQDTRIDLPDCGTTDGEHLRADKDNLKDLLWNYLIEPDGTQTVITRELIPSLIGKDIVVRTPGYCKSPEGFCVKCFGHVFEVVEQKAFAPIANDFAGTITTASLKSMHGKSFGAMDISNLNRYLIAR